MDDAHDAQPFVWRRILTDQVLANCTADRIRDPEQWFGFGSPVVREGNATVFPEGVEEHRTVSAVFERSLGLDDEMGNAFSGQDHDKTCEKIEPCTDLATATRRSGVNMADDAARFDESEHAVSCDWPLLAPVEASKPSRAIDNCDDVRGKAERVDDDRRSQEVMDPAADLCPRFIDDRDEAVGEGTPISRPRVSHGC